MGNTSLYHRVLTAAVYDPWASLRGTAATPPPVDTVPQSITPLQARRHLRILGMKAAADAYLATLSEEQQEAWEYCISVDRSNVFLNEAASVLLGTLNAQSWLDDFFKDASQLV